MTRPGSPPPLPEVEHPARLRQPGQQGAAVLHVAGDRPGSEKAELLRPEENGVEVGAAQEELASALMTTRRRGSSPSEMVATPSISLTMSWTILRSSGRHRLEDLVAPRFQGPLGRLAGELGQCLLAPGPVAGDVEMDPGAMAADPALDRRADEFLEGVDGGRPGPDQQAEVGLPRCRPCTSSSPSARAATVAGIPKRSTRPRAKASAISACSSSDTSDPDTASSSSPFELVSDVLALAAADAPGGFFLPPPVPGRLIPTGRSPPASAAGRVRRSGGDRSSSRSAGPRLRRPIGGGRRPRPRAGPAAAGPIGAGRSAGRPLGPRRPGRPFAALAAALALPVPVAAAASTAAVGLLPGQRFHPGPDPGR